MKKTSISKPAIMRLCTLYQILDNLANQEEAKNISSSELGRLLGVGAHNIRKDINFLGGGVGDIGSGYDIVKLRDFICGKLNLCVTHNACIVGLGRLGSAVLAYEGFLKSGYRILAAFDSNINRVETIRTDVEVFPACEITEVVKSKNIELGLIAVPASAAQETADRLIEGGVKGIVNFSPAVIQHDAGKVYITNMDVIREFSILSAMIMVGQRE